MNSDFPKDRRRRCRGGSIDWNGLFDQYAAEGGTLQDFYYGSFQKLVRLYLPLSRRIPSLSTFLVHMEEERDRRDPGRASVRAELYEEFLASGLSRTVFSRVKAGKHGYNAARMMAMLGAEQEMRRPDAEASEKISRSCPPAEPPAAEVVPDTVRIVSIPEGFMQEYASCHVQDSGDEIHPETVRVGEVRITVGDAVVSFTSAAPELSAAAVAAKLMGLRG